MNVVRGFFRHVVGLPTLYINVICIWIYYGRYLTEVHITELAIIISKCNNCKCEWHNCFNYLRWVSARSFSVTNSPIAWWSTICVIRPLAPTSIDHWWTVVYTVALNAPLQNKSKKVHAESQLVIKLTSVFHASFMLLITNFVITLSK